MTTISVYAGWQSDPIPEAAKTGELLAKAGFDVCYGGGNLGNMGAVAASAWACGAKITTVTLPEWVAPSDQLADELVLKSSLTERMAELEGRADAFLVLPGGRGTVAELYSVWADTANGAHAKPIVVLDPQGHFELLRVWDDQMVAPGMAKENTAVSWVQSPEQAVQELQRRLA